MRNSAGNEHLQRSLVRQGFSVPYILRILDEVEDHRVHLTAEAAQAGRDADSAGTYAAAKLGPVDQLVEQLIRARRRSEWWAQRPVLLFCFVPLLLLILSFAGGGFYLATIGSLQGWWDTATPMSDRQWMGLTMSVPLFHFGLMLALPAFFCRLARQYHYGRNWALAACLILTMHAFFHMVNVTVPRPPYQGGEVAWGYAIQNDMSGRLWIALPPLLMFGLYYFLSERRTARQLEAAHKLRRSSAPAALASVAALAFLILPGASFASDKILERGWIGGDYQLARAGWSWTSDNTIRAFPASLRKTQKAGIYVVEIPTHCPAAQAGLREGDLILKLDDQPIDRLKTWRARVDQSAPGQTIRLTVWRFGEVIELPVRVGAEKFRKRNSIGLGIYLTSRLDLWPDPDFSLGPVGYYRRHKRLDLHSTENRFIQATAESPKTSGESAMTSPESWTAWLAIFHLGGHTEVISQRE